jgi:predicted TPR repeat methyltransferase
MQDNAPSPVSWADWICREDMVALAAACGQEDCLTDRYVRQLLLAIPYQLAALLENGYVGQELVDKVFDIQRLKSVLVNPHDNWFTRNLHRFGQGFDLRLLATDAAIMARRFDRLAVHWEEYVTGCQYREVFSWLARAVRTLPPSLRSAGRVLDLACGVGLLGQTLRLTHVDGHITGVDLSSGMLAKAHARGCYDALVQANVNERLPFPDQSIDVGICTGAMELLDVDGVLRECNRVVKPGGSLWASFQYDDGVSPNPTAHQHIVGLTGEDILGRLGRWDFQVVAVEACPAAFLTPSEHGILHTVPYLFVRAERRLEQ